MSNLLNKFKQKLGIGARNNKYLFLIYHPFFINYDFILVKEVSLPSKARYDIDLYYLGKQLTISGEEDTSHTISVTFYDTEEHMLRDKFIKWIDTMRSVNVVKDYMYNAELYQLSTIDNSIKAKYNFIKIYPKNIGDINYSSDNNNNLLTFEVEFQFAKYYRK